MPSQNSSISNFKRFLLAIVLPLLLTVGGVGYLFNYFFEQKIILSNSLNGEYKVNRILNTPTPNEIPIFGSSRAAYIFIPDSLGNNYFNYGLAGTRYDVTLFFMEQECKKQKNTPWMIANLDLEGLGYGLGDVSSYIIYGSNSDVRKLVGKEYKNYFSIPLIKYFGRYENYIRLYLTSKIELSKFTNKGASIDKNSLPQKEFDEMVMARKNTAISFKNDTALERRLFALINSHSERNFLFVVSPYHGSYFDKYQNKIQARAFLEYLGSHQNVKVLDYSTYYLPDSMFLNTTHLNLKGAVQFNRIMRDTLNAMGVK